MRPQLGLAAGYLYIRRTLSQRRVTSSSNALNLLSGRSSLPEH